MNKFHSGLGVLVFWITACTLAADVNITEASNYPSKPYVYTLNQHRRLQRTLVNDSLQEPLDTPAYLSKPLTPTQQDSMNQLAMNQALDSVVRAAAVKEETSFMVELVDEERLYVRSSLGHWIAPERTHLRVEMAIIYDMGQVIYFWLFEQKGEDWKQLSFLELGDVLGAKDSISDLNGDGYGDYMTYYYPSSGCCLAHVYDLYLYQPKKRNLVAVGEVINPTFYPKEALVRGFTYGHGPESSLYTYRWRGAKLDTVEYLDPQFSTSSDLYQPPDYYLRTRWRRNGQKKVDRLDVVPDVYHTLNDADWWLER